MTIPSAPNHADNPFLSYPIHADDPGPSKPGRQAVPAPTVPIDHPLLPWSCHFERRTMPTRTLQTNRPDPNLPSQ